MEEEKCAYCVEDYRNRKPLMSSGKGDYAVYINSCNYLEDSEIGDWNFKFSLYGVKIKFCPVCGKELDKT